MASLIDTLIAKCNSWDDFVLFANNQQNNKFKGDLFERLTQVFLQTSSTYVSKLKNVWWCNNNELPENIRKKLRLPIADEGIDLICETVEGEFWSVQCKYKANQNQPLTHKELSTFTSLSFNTATDIVLGLVVHTSTKKVRKSNLMTNVTELGLEKWLEISKEDWKRIRTVCRSNKLLPPKKRKPRKHQKAAIKDAVHHYSALSKSRGKLIMPCGTGKSLTAFWIAQALEAKSIIVAVPSLTLVRDSLADWTAEFLSHGIKPNWIAVCSDNTVGATADADSTIATVYETGIPTTTDKQEIQKFLKRKSKSPKIVFTTYQSGQKLCDATNGSSIKFDLLICDEAHKTVGSSNKAFATLLFDENINAKHRIFMTATERIYRQSKGDVVSMDDPNVYGEVFHELSFKEAIKQKIICDYKILTVVVSANEAKALINSNQALRVADGKDSFETDAHNLMVGLTLQKVFERYQIKHAVTFHRSIKRAKFFSDQQDNFSSRLGIKNYHVSSKHSAGERAKMLKQFTNEKLSLISNARCLTEGVDIPAIDCVVFADPKHSTVDIVQAAGRAMRQSKDTGKDFGYILLPLIVPEHEDLTDFAETTSFSNVSRVITTLSTSDERIAEELCNLEVGPGKQEKRIIEIDDEYINLIDLESEKFKAAISTQIWKSVGRANWLNFEEARDLVQNEEFANSKDYQNKIIHLYPNIPIAPDQYYKYKGWISWGDWLGTGYETNIEWRKFDEAKRFIHTLKLKSQSDWYDYLAGKRPKLPALPNNIPKAPYSAYRDDWVGYPDWLGYQKKVLSRDEMATFKDALHFARSLKLSRPKDWKDYCDGKFPSLPHRPKNIPTMPYRTYKSEWISTEHWLGIEVKRFHSFTDERDFVRSLNLKSQSEFRNFIRENPQVRLATAPHQKYQNDGWINWGDWLGTGRVATREKKYLTLADARNLVRSMNINSSTDYLQWWRANPALSADLPAKPPRTYKNSGWIGWEDFLDKRGKMTFEELKEYVHQLKLKSKKQWEVHVRDSGSPDHLPIHVKTSYQSSWVSWADFLGSEEVNQRGKQWRAYSDAKLFVSSLSLKSQKEWQVWAKSGNRPDDIPSDPSACAQYKKEWVSWGDWLGARLASPHSPNDTNDKNDS